MSQFLGQILSLLTTPPGNLIYHTVLVFSLAGALQGAIHLLRSSQFPQARRTVVGLGILLGLQMILFVISGLAWQGLIDSRAILPPLDRAVTLMTLVWLTWLWAFPEPARVVDAVAILLNLLTLTLFSLTLNFWAANSGTGFNQSWFEFAWQAYSLVVALLGVIVLVIRRPNGWGNGLSMLGIVFLGHLVCLIRPMQGDFPGAVRLAQMAVFPLLLTLSQRFPGPTLEHTSVVVTAPAKAAGAGKTAQAEQADESEQSLRQERRRYSTDAKTLQALLTMAAEVEGEKIGQAITRGIAQAMLADLCFLIVVGEDKSLSLAYGYDLIREDHLGGTALNKDNVPLIAAAIQRGKPLRLPASSTSSDLKALAQLLGLSNAGHLLSVPIASRERGSLGGVLLLSPYSHRVWSAEDQTYLTNASALLVPVLERGQRASAMQFEKGQAFEEIEEARKRAAEADGKYQQATRELEALREKIAQSQVQAENIAALLVMEEEAQRTIVQLKAENQELRAGGGAPSEDFEQMERELRQTLEEMARMQNALAEANKKILELEERPAAPITSEQVDVIASISQELRQPMSSIVGYTDLLLGESVGILGALQRKFVERIKASTERVGGLVDDLIQITNLEAGKVEFKPEPIDLNLVIDSAMSYTGTLIREKNITLRLDIPDTAPRVQTDRDAFQQVLIHLLQNAASASQPEGTVLLRLQSQQDNGNHFLTIQVTDSGGGIDPADISRVFARRYRAEHSLIQGLGDTGVGLSIAKTLVEAQHGRIWVETEAGVGSTFSVVLPVLLEEEK